MLRNYHVDFSKIRIFTKAMHGNTKRYVLTVTEATILQEIMLWK